MDYNLRLEITQKLVMTPQLCQAIAILQLSSLELSALVSKELAENPALEEEEYAGDTAEEDADCAEPTSEKAAETDYAEWIEFFNDGRDMGYMPALADTEHREMPIASSADVTLRDHLLFQLQYAMLAERERKIGEYLIEGIDEDGYLRVSAEDISKAIGSPVSLVLDVLKIVQTFDPAGVGARDLRECLALQIERNGVEDLLAPLIVDRFLDKVAAGQIRQIAQQLNCSVQEVQAAVDVIRSLDPKPGRGFASGADPCYIVPDVILERRQNDYQITINDHDVPSLTVNPYYRRAMQEGRDSSARKFVEGRINAAMWLIKSIDQRRRTLYSVMEALVRLQREFLDHGPQYLKPLTLRNIAEQVGVHESTVSRAVANKYVQTPQGLYPMRIFFSAGVSGTDGCAHAALQVKQVIRDLISREDRQAPLSDQALCDILGRQGIQLSRRTVAKYREEMDIPSSGKRRRYS